jgi:hypothetical protein
MRLLLKLLLGVGTKEEDYNPTAFNMFFTAIGLMLVFFGSLLLIIYLISNII